MNNTTNVTDILMDSGCSPSASGLAAYACFYWHVHGIASLVLCCFGVPTNVVNIVILTRKKMRSPINCILTGIAVSDALTMISYIPFSIHFYILHGLQRTPEKYTYGWVWFLVIHSNLSIITHTVAIWLGVCMSIVRYTYIRSMGRSQSYADIKRACGLVVAVFIVTILAYIPMFVFSKVVSEKYIDERNVTQYSYGIRNLQLGGDNQTTLEAALAWIFILFGKFFPCIFITIFGGLLLHSLHESKKRTISLRGARCEDRLKQHQRTTLMLLVIILMFILTEMPSSIAVLIGLSHEYFFSNIYPLLADTLDMLSLINNTANFVMYCAMSRQFRDCLIEITCENMISQHQPKTYQTVRSQTATTAMGPVINGAQHK